MSAWNHWYLTTATAYGQWLRGDPRGWRERNHRQHVDGDYKTPPEESAYNDAIFEQSQRLLRYPPVVFVKEERKPVGLLVLESLAIQQVEVIAIAVNGKHIHTLIRCPKDNPKIITGKVKHNVWRKLRPEVVDAQGGRLPLFADKSHAEPMADRPHQVNSFEYVLDHAEEGGWVWSFRQGYPPEGPARARGL